MIHCRRLAVPVAVMLALAFGPGPATAENAAADPGSVVTLEVLPGWRTAEGHHMAGLRLRLAPGWKTYWRTPGAAGLPPIFDFAGSTGIAAVEPAWPVPTMFGPEGARSIGYDGEVTIPLDLTLAEGATHLAGEVEIGVCQEICMPVRLSFAVDLPVEGDRDPAIVAALVDRPMTPQEADASATCDVSPTSEGLGLVVRVAMPALGPDEAVVIESADPSLWISGITVTRHGPDLVATAEALARDGGPASLDRASLRITVLGGGRAVDIPGCDAG